MVFVMTSSLFGGGASHAFVQGEASLTPPDVVIQLGGQTYTLPVSGTLTAQGTFTVGFAIDEVFEQVLDHVEDNSRWDPPTGETLRQAASALFGSASDAFGDALESVWNATSAFRNALLDAFDGDADAQGGWSVGMALGNLSFVSHYSLGPVPVPLPLPGYVGPLLPGWAAGLGNPWPHSYNGPPLEPHLAGSVPRPDLIAAALLNSGNWTPVDWDVSAWVEETIEHFADALAYSAPQSSAITCSVQASLEGLSDLNVDLDAFARQLFGSRRPDEYWSLLTGLQLSNLGRDAASSALEATLQEIQDGTVSLQGWVEACFPGSTGWAATPNDVQSSVEAAFETALGGALSSGQNALRGAFKNGFPATTGQLRSALEAIARDYVDQLDNVFDELRDQDAGNSFLVFGAILLQLLGGLDPRSVIDALSEQLAFRADDADACAWVLDTLTYLLRDLQIGSARPFHSTSLIQHAIKAVVQALVPHWEVASAWIEPWIEGLLGDGLIGANRLPFTRTLTELLAAALAGMRG